MIVCYQYAIDVFRPLELANSIDRWMDSNFISSRYTFIRPNDHYGYNGEFKVFGLAAYTPICAWKIKSKKND